MDERAPSRGLARAGLVGGILLSASIWLSPLWGFELAPGRPELNRMAAIAGLMAAWWITEAVPIAVTALLPLVLFPLGKIMPAADVAVYYADPNIFLYLGGFLVALAIEESGLHERLALWTVCAVGERPSAIVAGFMLATGFLSMWTSNTATTMLMLPIAISVLRGAPGDGVQHRRFATALMLSIAYSASIGGIATLIGTPTNVLFRAFVERQFPHVPPIGFAAWMAVAGPISVVFLLVTWFAMTFLIFPLASSPIHGESSVIRQRLAALGPLRPAEQRMMCLFGILAFLWIFREPVPGWGWGALLGWGRDAQIGGRAWVDDGTVAMILAIACFLLPSGDAHKKPLLSWEATRRLPWGVVFLFGGGFALAGGMAKTSLDRITGDWLGSVLDGMSPVAMAVVVALVVTFFTELTSNVACLNMILPILATASDALHVHPLLLMVPATISSSCAFMLPVGTPPNAIVYSTGHVRSGEMCKAGFYLDLIGVAVTCAFVFGIGPTVLGLRW